MVELKSNDSHTPQGMVIDVNEIKAEELLATGEYEYVSKENKPKKVVSKDKPNESWTEKEIKTWIKQNNIEIQYHISSETKKDILLKLKHGGYL